MISPYVEEEAARQELDDARKELEAATLRYAAARARLDRYLHIPVNLDPAPEDTP